MDQSNYTQTNNVDIVGQSADNTTPISWNLELEYATTDGYVSFTSNTPFTTNSGSLYTTSAASDGGFVTLQASQGADNVQKTVTVNGIQIPNSTISAYLRNLYSNGATPDLMTGIAYKESTYQQFRQFTLYSVNALWPNESYDHPKTGPNGGSHIGLMQMPVSLLDAWNWQTNTTDGVNLFTQTCLPEALTNELNIRRTHTGLVALTSVQRENMALVLYGPYAHSTDLTQQYYAPSCVNGTISGSSCVGGNWQWIVNTAGNSLGVGYANSVRADMQ